MRRGKGRLLLDVLAAAAPSAAGARAHTAPGNRRRLRAVGLALLGALVFSLIASQAAGAHVYWTNFNTNTIGRANLDGTMPNQSFITGATRPDGVAVDAAHVYWTNRDTGTIGRANLDGTSPNQNFIAGASHPYAVAVDAAHVYWANAAAGTIGRANLDGTSPNQSFIAGASLPEGVAVDAAHVYWANSSTGTIGRANLDGSGANQSFITRANGPIGVAVDAAHVYFANNNGATIWRANLDGTSPNPSFIIGTSPVGVAVDAAHVYWTNFTTNTIARANLDGTSPNQNFITGASLPFGVAVDALPPPPPPPPTCPSGQTGTPPNCAPAPVSDAPLVWTFNPNGSTPGGGSQTRAFAGFTDTDPSPITSDLTADIEWGDNQTSHAVPAHPFSLPSFGLNRLNLFYVDEPHRYKGPQITRHHVRITIHDRAGAQLNTTYTYDYLPDALILKRQQKAEAGQRAIQEAQMAMTECQLEIGLGFLSQGKSIVAGLIAAPILKRLGYDGCIDGYLQSQSDHQKFLDPPSRHYRAVVRPRRFPSVGVAHARCGRIKPRACSRLRRAIASYAAANDLVSSFKEASAITQDRYTGALLAKARRSARMQARAFSRYLREEATSSRRARTAARRLGRELRRDQIDLVLSGPDLSQAIRGVLTQRNIPRAIITRLQRDGLGTAADQQRQLAEVIATSPPPTKISLVKLLMR